MSINPMLLHAPGLDTFSQYLKQDAPMTIRRVAMDETMLKQVTLEDYDAFARWCIDTAAPDLDSPERAVLELQRNKVRDRVSGKKRKVEDVTHLYNRIRELEVENAKLRKIVTTMSRARERVAAKIDEVVKAELLASWNHVKLLHTNVFEGSTTPQYEDRNPPTVTPV